MKRLRFRLCKPTRDTTMATSIFYIQPVAEMPLVMRPTAGNALKFELAACLLLCSQLDRNSVNIFFSKLAICDRT